jgi:hypothetical protein
MSSWRKDSRKGFKVSRFQSFHPETLKPAPIRKPGWLARSLCSVELRCGYITARRELAPKMRLAVWPVRLPCTSSRQPKSETRKRVLFQVQLPYQSAT